MLNETASQRELIGRSAAGDDQVGKSGRAIVEKGQEIDRGELAALIAAFPKTPRSAPARSASRSARR